MVIAGVGFFRIEAAGGAERRLGAAVVAEGGVDDAERFRAERRGRGFFEELEGGFEFALAEEGHAFFTGGREEKERDHFGNPGSLRR